MEEQLKQLSDLTAEVKVFTGKAQEDIKNLGAVTLETKTAYETILAKVNALQSQTDALETKTQRQMEGQPEPAKTLSQLIIEHPDFVAAQKSGFINSKRPITMEFATGPFQRKTNITNTALGAGTSGVGGFERLPGVTVMAQQELRVRDLMTVANQGTGFSFDWLRQKTRTNVASPQVEASAKSESTYDYETVSGTIRTIAHFLNVSKQALSDLPWLRTQLDSELMYGLKLKEESEILAGSGTGVHLNGIITQATAFDTSLLIAAAGWTRIDVLRMAKLQARLAGLATYAPSGIVLHPTDMARIESTKDTTGLYIVGDPTTGQMVKFVWGLPVVESDSITSGTFLVGAFNTGATLIDREQAGVEISFEHSSNFTSNLATILCEERIGLAVRVPTAFITGSFTTSP